MNSYLNRTTFILLLSLGFVTSSAHAADDAQEIVNNYIKAAGGEKAIRNIKTRITEGTMSMGPIQGDITIYQKEPNLFKMTIKLGQFGEMETGYDGKRGWRKAPGAGLADLPKGELDQQLRDLALHRDLELEKYFSSKKIVAGKEFNGKMTDAIELTQKNGEKQTWYFDKSTHLLTHIDATADAGPQGMITTSTDIGNYREVDGINVPMKSSTVTPITPVNLEFKSVKHNQELDITTFQP